MCGICGFNWRDDETLTKMVYSLRHRGPDDAGYYTDERMSLGHRRLKVIDVAAAAHQPMSDPDRSVWITYNGEIYNFRELRRTFQEAGTTFRSTSDTEVIIHAFKRSGIQAFSSFNGMWPWRYMTRNLAG